MESAAPAWAIEKLEMTNFRAFRQFSIDFHSRLTVLVGVNGSGKTAVLDALAIMLSTVLREFDGDKRGFLPTDAHEVASVPSEADGAASGHRLFPVSAQVTCLAPNLVFTSTGPAARYIWGRSRKSASGRTTWAESSTLIGTSFRKLWNDSLEGTAHTPLPVIALYGVERLSVVRPDRSQISRNRNGAYDSALDGKSDLKRLSKLIKDLSQTVIQSRAAGRDPGVVQGQLDAITSACNNALAPSGWRDPEWNFLRNEVTLAHPEHGRLPLSQMSAGIRITAGLVIDIVSRMARAHPGLGGNELLERVPGIVMIDEVDLHLHPGWQQQLVPALLSTFPAVQFIVTTHSPQVLSSVDAECIRVINGEEVLRVNHAAGLDSGTILEQILGVRPEPNLPINQNLDAYLSLVDQGEGLSTEAKALRERIDEKLGGAGNVRSLADADVSIAFYDEDD